jgi:hypothetical protein
MSQPPFCFHLSTLTIAMLAAAILLWLNIAGGRMYENSNMQHGVTFYGWPMPVILADDIKFITKEDIDMPIMKRAIINEGATEAGLPDTKRMLIIDVFVNCSLLLIVAIICEFAMRRRDFLVLHPLRQSIPPQSDPPPPPRPDPDKQDGHGQ